MSTGPILLLYWNPYGQLRDAVARHLEAVAAAVPRERLVAHNAIGGAPAVLKRLRPSAVIFHTTFLATRWLVNFEDWRDRGRWLETLDVPKLALPQDDYDHSDVLDDWLVDLGVSTILTPLARFEMLYPRSRVIARVDEALTGYVDERIAAEIETWSQPLEQRPHDLVYRASDLPYWFGRQGQLKRRIAEAAAAAAGKCGWSADISTEEVIAGPRWFAHLGSGRAVIGCEGGSSVLDRRGDIRKRIEEFLILDPDATFEEIAAKMPPGWDDDSYTALSPRHLEAAMTKTPQVLVRGAYSGVLVPGEHYIPVSEDLSDIEDAISQALEPRVAASLVENSWADLVESGSFSYRRLTEKIQTVLPEQIGRVPAWAGGVLAPARALAATRQRIGAFRHRKSA